MTEEMAAALRIGLTLAGILLLLTMKYTEKAVDRAISKVFTLKCPSRGKAAALPLGNKPVSGADSPCSLEEDLLDNKKKWRIIVAGYVFFIVVAIFSFVALFTLNRKINTLYGSIQYMEERIGELENQDGK